MRLLMTAHPCDDDDDDGSQADELPVRQREDNFTINVDPISLYRATSSRTIAIRLDGL